MPVYIAEIAPQNLRGGLGSVNQVEALLLLLDAGLFFLYLKFINFVIFLAELSVTISTMLAYLLGPFVNWRVLAILGKLLIIYLA